MRDYTTNNYCDFLWISDLLELKRNGKNEFTFETKKGQSLIKCNVLNVTVFGTIVEVKEVGFKGILYQIDDGTGVIACRRSDDQFEEIMSVIESEQFDILNKTVDVSQSFEQSFVADTSADDSVFNDRSIQLEEITFNKKSRLRGIQSLWDDIYKTFHNLIEPYKIGDSVIIQGKLYTYFNINQIYVNNIRALDIDEEMMLLSIKLEDSFDRSTELDMPDRKIGNDKRLSGYVTFDNIPHLNRKISIPKIESPQLEDDVISRPDVVTPNLEPTITFDTFTNFGASSSKDTIENFNEETALQMQIDEQHGSAKSPP